MTIEATCHCGACVLVADAAPNEVTECNCSICRRYGVRWAYYPLAGVDRARMGATDSYAWDDRSINFHRCAGCGCVTHWWPNDDRDRMGINARLFPPDAITAPRLRYLDGAVSEGYLD